MKFKQFGNKYFIRIDKGEEVVETLKKFCIEQNIKLGSISAIGATDKAELGYFEAAAKKYHKKLFTGDLEIAPLIGNITTLKDEVYLHLHANLANTKQEAFAGHLGSAVISVTFEGIIEKIDGNIDRYFDKEIGLNLLKL